MKKEHAAFAERLRHLLVQGKFGLNRRKLAQRLFVHGKVVVTEQTVGGWINGKHMPKPDAMRGLAVMLGTHPNLLQWGGKPPSEVREPRTLWPEHVSGPDRLMFEAYMALPAKERNVVRDLVDTLTVSVRQKRKG